MVEILFEDVAHYWPRRWRFDELSAAQARTVASFDSPPVVAWRLGLPASQTGWDVLLGRSESLWAKEVETENGKMPVYYAVTDLAHLEHTGQLEDHCEAVCALLMDWPLEDVLRLGDEAEDQPDLGYANGVHAWPFHSNGGQKVLIAGRSVRDRKAF